MYYLNVRYQGSSWGEPNGLLEKTLMGSHLGCGGWRSTGMAGIQLYCRRASVSKWTLRGESRWAEREGEDGCWTTWEVTEAHEERGQRRSPVAEWPKDCFIPRLNNTSSPSYLYCCNVNSFQIPALQFVFFFTGRNVGSKNSLCEDIETEIKDLGLEGSSADLAGLPLLRSAAAAHSIGRPGSQLLPGLAQYRIPTQPHGICFPQGKGNSPQADEGTMIGRWGRKTTDASYAHISRERIWGRRERSRDPHSGHVQWEEGNSCQRWEFRGDRSSKNQRWPWEMSP